MIPRFAVFGGALLLAGAGVLWAGRHKAARVLDKLERVAGMVSASATGNAGSRAAAASGAGPAGKLDVHAHAPGPHPRILLTRARLARLAPLRDSGADSWKALSAQCHEAREKNIEAGYEGFEWAHAALGLALCAKVTGDQDYAATGVRYLKALLDDKSTMGDGAGGDAVVRHDDGYPIRTHGMLGAIAYDWLHDAPGMSPDLRKHAVDRFTAWAAWFREKGFEHDQPISNYYVGYFGAVALAGIAAEGDDPRAEALRRQTQDMWNRELVPTYRTKLAGGDYSEGWQYGDLVGATLAIFADAESNRGAPPEGPSSPSLFDDLPWLRESVTLHAFALWPDGKHTYDNGDWSDKPAVAPPHMLEALSIVLPSSDPAGRKATSLARLARRAHPDHEDFTWLRALADDPSRPAEDPRRPQTSYLAPGTATFFARGTAPSPGGLWASITFEPSLSPHEHHDAGHFEVVRGSDALFIDAGGYESFSSYSHNVVIVDDPKQSPDFETSSKNRDIITYKGIQGSWSYTSHVARQDDGGGYAYALGSYDSAFNPISYPEDRHDHAVSRAEREFLYSRAPVASAAGAGGGETGRLVVYDRFTFTDPRFTTTFILHGGLAPQITGPVARFTTGGSSAWVTTLLPRGGVPSVVDETHNKPSNDRVYFTNVPPDGVTSFRYQVAFPPSYVQTTERRLLHAIVLGGLGGASPGATAIDGPDVAGAVIDGEAYVFSSDGPASSAARVSYRAPAAAGHHIVADLAPSAAYAVSSAHDGDACKITLTPGTGKTATPAGVLAFDVADCSVR